MGYIKCASVKGYRCFPVNFVKNTFFHRTNVVVASEFKGALEGLRQFLITESPLKMMKKKVFYFNLKALFVLKIFKFSS